MDRQHGVGPAIGQQRRQGRGIAFGIGPDPEIDGIGSAALEPCQDSASIGELIGGERPDPVAVRKNGETLAGKRALPPERLHRREHRVEIGNTEQARPAEGGLVDRIRPREGTRMGEAACPAHRVVGRVPAGPQHHHGLGAGRRPGRRHELAGVPHHVDGEQDRPGPDVPGEMVEAVGDIDVAGLAQGHHRGEPDAAPRRPGDDPRSHGPGLRDQREVARGGRPGEEAGIEPGAR